MIVDGQVLKSSTTPGPEERRRSCRLLYAGQDASEEFNMLHDPKAIPRYTPDSVIGKDKA